MAIHRTPTIELVDDALRTLGAGEEASEAHGSLCGLTCVLGPRAQPVWLASLELTDTGAGPGSGPDLAVLDDLAAAAFSTLSEGDMSFAPLLPADEMPLALRAEALASWCAGFMHGLGEASGGRPTREVLASDTSREIIEDFAEIARLTLGEDETDLEAESAYAELVEFVRVSVQLIFEELYEARRDPALAAVH
jgi:uncharacterized protein YgfB (UPF0149 family)